MTGHLSLDTRIARFLEDSTADRFESLALETFAYQYEHNLPYRQFCDRRRLTPEQVREWRRIPAVPTSAFKVAELTCRPGYRSTTFLTSGTTRGVERRGRHLVADLALPHAAILSNAQAHLFPDLALGADRMLLLSLTPPPALRPHSSLVHMITLLIERWGAPGSGHLGTATGLDAERLSDLLRHAEAEERPVALLGTTAAFALFFTYCDAQAAAWTLPAGSRLMDTGGGKGLPAAGMIFADRPVFLETCRRTFGLPPHAVVNEYGMTELSSQFYDEGLAGRTTTDRKAIPHWVRVRPIDPRTDDDVPNGAPGLLRLYDLANLHSVMAIQTDDVGVCSTEAAGRFQLLGRAAGAEPRGCSLDPAAQSVSAP